jgi:hypothetical protein
MGDYIPVPVIINRTLSCHRAHDPGQHQPGQITYGIFSSVSNIVTFIHELKISKYTFDKYQHALP